MREKRRSGGGTVDKVSDGATGAPHVLDDRIWLVFARKSYDEPLHEVGTVEADDQDLAVVYAKAYTTSSHGLRWLWFHESL